VGVEFIVAPDHSQIHHTQ